MENRCPSVEMLNTGRKQKPKCVKEKLGKARAFKKCETEEGTEAEEAIEIKHFDDPSCFRTITVFRLIVKQLKRGCKFCLFSPLALVSGDLDGTKHPNRLNINCEKCNGINKIELYDNEVEEKQVLGTLHSGIGFTHLEGILSIVGLPCMTSAKYKKLQRVVGESLENVARESCSKWKLEDQRIEVDTTGTAELKGRYDMSSRTRTRMYNSNSGSGCMVGHNTGKRIDYETQIKDSRLCNDAAKTGANPKNMTVEKITLDLQNQWSHLSVKYFSAKVTIK